MTINGGGCPVVYHVPLFNKFISLLLYRAVVIGDRMDEKLAKRREEFQKFLAEDALKRNSVVITGEDLQAITKYLRQKEKGEKTSIVKKVRKWIRRHQVDQEVYGPDRPIF